MKIQFLFLFFFSSFSTLLGQFTDVTDSLTIDAYFDGGPFGGGVSFYDYNDDGWDDLTFATGMGEPPLFYRNEAGSFVQDTFQISHTEQSKQILWVDYDNDADQDLFITTFAGQNRLFQNDGEFHFTDVTFSAGLAFINDLTFGATFGDINNDGYLDLYICNRVGQTSGLSNYLFLNNGDGTFNNISASSGTAAIGTLTFVAAFFDHDGDGFQDIYLAEDKNTSPNELFHNNGNLTFSNYSSITNVGYIMDAMNVGVADYDYDGDLDFYVTDTEQSRFARNFGNGIFTDIAATTETQLLGRFNWAANFFDYDLDTDLDLYVCSSDIGNGYSNTLFEQITPDTFHAPLSPNGLLGDTLRSYSFATGDFNNDGLPDFAVTNLAPDSSQIWKNIGDTTKHWLKVKLQGTQSNRDGIGSWIEVWHDGERQTRYTHCGEAFLAQNARYGHFGLDTISMVDSVVVKWLSGVRDVVTSVPIDTMITVVEASSVLPIELLSFTAKHTDEYIDLNWQISATSNTQCIDIQRSIDAINFKNIAVLHTFPSQYQDRKIKENTSYFYRLKMVDLEGQFSYSPIRMVQTKAVDVEVIILQNPILNQKINLQISAAKNSVIHWQLIHPSGQLIQQKEIAISSELQQFPIDMTGLAKGIYWLRIAGQHQQKILKVIY